MLGLDDIAAGGWRYLGLVSGCLVGVSPVEVAGCHHVLILRALLWRQLVESATLDKDAEFVKCFRVGDGLLDGLHPFL